MDCRWIANGKIGESRTEFRVKSSSQSAEWHGLTPLCPRSSKGAAWARERKSGGIRTPGFPGIVLGTYFS